MPENIGLVKKPWVKLNGILEYWNNGKMGGTRLRNEIFIARAN